MNKVTWQVWKTTNLGRKTCWRNLNLSTEVPLSENIVKTQKIESYKPKVHIFPIKSDQKLTSNLLRFLLILTLCQAKKLQSCEDKWANWLSRHQKRSAFFGKSFFEKFSKLKKLRTTEGNYAQIYFHNPAWTAFFLLKVDDYLASVLFDAFLVEPWEHPL